MKIKNTIMFVATGILLYQLFKKKTGQVKKPTGHGFIKELVSEIKEPLSKTASEIHPPY